jgi:acetyl esterase/lipase
MLIPLWPAGAPHARGPGELHEPALSVHLPAPSTATGCGIVVCPGGGYRVLASDHEGLQVARALNRMGIAAFVLRYRVGPTYHSSLSILDGQRAMRWVRSRAAEFGIGRLGLLGFSAGGHLTVAVGTLPGAGAPDAADPVDRLDARPDFLVPVYAVTNGLARGRKADEYTPADTRVDAKTPPTFLVHTHEDATVPPEQSLLFYRALHAAGVPAELHVYGFGEHGVGLAVGDPDVAEWLPALRRWLRRSAFLTTAERVSVRGRLTVGDRPLAFAWVTLVPDDPNAPLARVKFDDTAGGAFDIDRAHGPVPGPHTAIVHRIAERQPYDASGAYTLDDAIRYETRCDIRADSALILAFP